MKIFKLIATAAFALSLFVTAPVAVFADISASETPVNNNVTGVNTSATSSTNLVGTENQNSIVNSNQLAQASEAGSSLTWLWWTLLVVALISLFTYLFKQASKSQ